MVTPGSGGGSRKRTARHLAEALPQPTRQATRRGRSRPATSACAAAAAPTHSRATARATRTRTARHDTPGAIERRWTRERVLDAMRAWRELRGRPPTSYDWTRPFGTLSAARAVAAQRTVETMRELASASSSLARESIFPAEPPRSSTPAAPLHRSALERPEWRSTALLYDGLRSASDLGGQGFPAPILGRCGRVDLHGPRYSTSVRSHNPRFAELPADPLGLFWHFASPRAVCSGEVDASRDATRDSATCPAAPLGRGGRRQVASV